MNALTMRRPVRPAAARLRRGIALIEVLVALLIFMLGVLGLVGLQSAMTRAQTESKFRSDAAFLAAEVVGRMWADVANLASYGGTACESLARCKEWQDKVGTTLPQGSGTVTLGTGDAASDATVTISWTPPGGEARKYVTSTAISKGAS